MENSIAEGFKGEKAIITPYNIRAYFSKNTITSQLYITHIGYYPDANYHYKERENGTSENIFIYCDKGMGWVEYKEEKYTLTENQFFILPANERHAYGADKKNPWSIYWFHFKGNNVNMFSSIIGRLINIDESDRSRHRDRMQLFDEIYQNFEMGYNPDNLEYITFCLLHFMSSLKYIPQYREIKRVKENDLIQQCILFMKNNLENKILVGDIADAVGYSSSHLNALFVQRTSISPIEYFNQLRIQRACTYLQFSELKIKEIAYRLKYFDQFHFSKAFQKEMEITPSQYRKRYQEKFKPK